MNAQTTFHLNSIQPFSFQPGHFFTLHFSMSNYHTHTNKQTRTQEIFLVFKVLNKNQYLLLYYIVALLKQYNILSLKRERNKFLKLPIHIKIFIFHLTFLKQLHLHHHAQDPINMQCQQRLLQKGESQSYQTS